MWQAQLGAIVLVSQPDSAFGWIMFAVSVACSWIVRRTWLTKRPFVLYDAGCMAAVMSSICRDFDIPADMVVIASLPILYVNWKQSLPIQIAWYGVFVLNYVVVSFWIPGKSLKSASNSFAMPVFTIIALAKAKSFALALGVVLCRQIIWKTVHVFYGIVLCCHTAQLRLPLLDQKLALCFVVNFFFIVSIVFSDVYPYILGSIGVISSFFNV